MAAPTRPTSGASIESVWGMAVHDGLFVPVGSIASSALVSAIATALVKLPLTIGGPNLNGGDFLIPAGGDGVYQVTATVIYTTLGTATNVRVAIYKNGVVLPGASRWSAIGATGGGSLESIMVALVAGDRIALYTSGGGTTAAAQATGYLYARKVGESLT